MKKVGIFILMISIFSTTFFISNRLSAQVEPLNPLPAKPFKPIQSNQKIENDTKPIPIISNDLYLAGGRGGLGGWIEKKKAKKIEYLENQGYECTVFAQKIETVGQTIEIEKQNKRGKYPTSYFIPKSVNYKYQIEEQKAIIGYREGTTTIICKFPNRPVEEVILSNITKYGVSKEAVALRKIR